MQSAANYFSTFLEVGGMEGEFSAVIVSSCLLCLTFCVPSEFATWLIEAQPSHLLNLARMHLAGALSEETKHPLSGY